MDKDRKRKRGKQGVTYNFNIYSVGTLFGLTPELLVDSE